MGSDDREPVRINRLFSMLGICSRREADRLISSGRVDINGRKALPGDMVYSNDRLSLDGRPVDISRGEAQVILAFNKPRGIVCTSSKKDRAPNIIDYIGYPTHIYPIGRLDKDSEGLILLTNMGELVNRINRAENHHEKEYEVELEAPVPEGFAERLMKGVIIEVPDRGRVRAGCRSARKTGEKSLNIVLTEGMNRQIRRMCGSLGGRVRRLKRVRIMNIRLGDLGVGELRELDEREKAEILNLTGADAKSC